MVKPAKKVQVQSKSRSPVKLIAGVAIVAVVGLAAVALTSGGPKENDIPVPTSAPPANPEGYLLGNPDAPVRVDEFADFECGACMQFATITEPDVRERLVATGQVAFRYFFFPLPQHPGAASAAYAAACAADQNRFWEMHDAIFQGFDDWALGRARNPKNVFENYAERIGLDVATWSECYDSDKHTALIQSHVTAGTQRGVNSTPTFFIGDEQVNGVRGYDEFKRHVDEALAKAGNPPPTPGGAPLGDTAATRAVPAPPATPAGR